MIYKYCRVRLFAGRNKENDNRRIGWFDLHKQKKEMVMVLIGANGKEDWWVHIHWFIKAEKAKEIFLN